MEGYVSIDGAKRDYWVWFDPDTRNAGRAKTEEPPEKLRGDHEQENHHDLGPGGASPVHLQVARLRSCVVVEHGGRRRDPDGNGRAGMVRP